MDTTTFKTSIRAVALKGSRTRCSHHPSHTTTSDLQPESQFLIKASNQGFKSKCSST